MIPPRWTELTAVFGGVFDPPHMGHREAVRGLFQDPGVKRVLVVPAPSPAYKLNQVSAEHRVEMVRRTFASNPDNTFPNDVEISFVDIERALRNPKSHTYTFDTLQELGRVHENLAFVLGADQLQNLPNWHRFPEVLELAHWIVLTRRPNGLDSAMRALRELESRGIARKMPGTADDLGGVWQLRAGKRFLRLSHTEAPEISSTGIRETISRTGQPPSGSLVPEAMAYLKQNRLYGSNANENSEGLSR
ncbi:MAG: hypothetical protein A2X94_01170 [Bdellovibrionales bacterium GWB1_55_8]|nr:MAG: hypothetical protein A2X94_01170 [Bdellovibrionales bacterium GWB1_55_8]